MATRSRPSKGYINMASVYRTWADGDAFTAADAGTYFMRQALIVCDNQTDRDAILTPNEGLHVYRKDLDAIEVYTGSSWLPVKIGCIPKRRQGGSSTVWGTAGTTNYDLSALTTPKMQVGVIAAAGNNTDNFVTFPEAYTYTPVIVLTPTGSGGFYPDWYLVSTSNTGFNARAGGNMTGGNFNWIAIGI